MAEVVPVTAKGRPEQAGPESTRGGIYFTPRFDIYETENELLLMAEVPGVKAEDVNLHYEQGELILHAQVKPRANPERFLAREYEVGDFYRAFKVSESIDASKIEASCKNGVLTLHLPKVEAARPRQIKVHGE